MSRVRSTTKHSDRFIWTEPTGLVVRFYVTTYIYIGMAIAMIISLFSAVSKFSAPLNLAVGIGVPLTILFIAQGLKNLNEDRKLRRELASNLIMLHTDLIQQVIQADGKIRELSSEETYTIPLGKGGKSRAKKLPVHRYGVIGCFDDKVWSTVVTNGFIGLLDPGLARNLQEFYLLLGQLNSEIVRRNEIIRRFDQNINDERLNYVNILNYISSSQKLKDFLPQVRYFGAMLAFNLQRPLSHLQTVPSWIIQRSPQFITTKEDKSKAKFVLPKNDGRDPRYWNKWLDAHRAKGYSIAAWENNNFLFCLVFTHPRSTGSEKLICEIIAPLGTYQWGSQKGKVIKGLTFLSSLRRVRPGNIPKVFGNFVMLDDAYLNENVVLTPLSAYDILYKLN